MSDPRTTATGARMQRLSTLAASALQSAALAAVLGLADQLLEQSCADLLEATKPPPALIAKEDDSWGVFGSDSDDDDQEEEHLASPPEAAAAGRERAAATAAVAGLRDAIAALRQAGAAVSATSPNAQQFVEKDDASWGVFGSEEESDGDEEQAVEHGGKQTRETDSSGSGGLTASAAATRAAAAAHGAATSGWGELQAAGGWSTPAWREVFCLSSVAGAVASTLVSSTEAETVAATETQTEQSRLQQAMRAADLAFILGCPPAVCRPVCALIDHRLRLLMDTAAAVASQDPTPLAGAAGDRAEKLDRLTGDVAGIELATTETPSLACPPSCETPFGAPEIKCPIPRVAQVRIFLLSFHCLQTMERVCLVDRLTLLAQIFQKSLSLEEFEASYYRANSSVVLTGCTTDWVSQHNAALPPPSRGSLSFF